MTELLRNLGTEWTIERLQEAAGDVAFKAQLKKMLEERKRIMERKADGEAFHSRGPGEAVKRQADCP
ncbi:hypothetical protein QS257_06785 [Terrilactibacillus sp. S3-3]|nr:hypothetical protein QS257_06785 [Terrilactibacillus sp. S3-3]